MGRLSIDISDDLHKTLKVHTAHRKKTVRDFITEAIYDRIESQKELNEETIKTLEESKKGINLTSYSSWEEMFVEIQKEIDEESQNGN